MGRAWRNDKLQKNSQIFFFCRENKNKTVHGIDVHEIFNLKMYKSPLLN